MPAPAPFFTTSTLLAGNTLEVDVHIDTTTVTALSGFGGLGGFNATVTYDPSKVTGVTATPVTGFTPSNGTPSNGTWEIAAADFSGAATSVVTSGNDVIEILKFALQASVSTLAGSVLVHDYNDAAANAYTNTTSATLVACFASGTRIATSRGDVPVESLRPDTDWAITSDGAAARIRWIGRRSARLAGHPRPWDVMPVRIVQHAFGPDLPQRDLLLSPDHALYVDGVLVPVRYLINGASIAQEDHDHVLWYHVELDFHDAILAEGLPAESYLDTGNRHAFDNGGPLVALDPDFAVRDATALRIWAEQAMAPLVTDGPVLCALRARLIARAAELGFATTADAAPRLLVDGRILVPQQDGSGLRFDLPPGARHISLLSRVFAPADLDPDSQDRRRLGLAVTWLEIDGMPIPPDSPIRRTGWHAPEPAWHWTDGAATLDCPNARSIRLGLAAIGMRHETTLDDIVIRQTRRALPSVSAHPLARVS